MRQSVNSLVLCENKIFQTEVKGKNVNMKKIFKNCCSKRNLKGQLEMTIFLLDIFQPTVPQFISINSSVSLANEKNILNYVS